MDINCTNQCHFQYDGKCTLNDITGLQTTNKLEDDSETDCPYCQK